MIFGLMLFSFEHDCTSSYYLSLSLSFVHNAFVFPNIKYNKPKLQKKKKTKT
jgi:hypothetical protein